MSNYVQLGPVRVRIGSKHLAPWGFPRLEIGGLSIWDRTNGGERMLLAYHPRASITWLWFVLVSRRSHHRFTPDGLAMRRRLFEAGNPHAPRPRWWHAFLDIAAVRHSQWHHFVRLPFGFTLTVARQRAMWRRP